MKPLGELLRAAGLSTDGVRGEMPVDRMVHHSEEVEAGDMFVALRGHTRDGHDFVTAAYRNGARVFLCEHPVPLPVDATLILSKNIRKSSAEMLSCLYNAPQKHMKITAVTGTKGKTTVACALHRLLTATGHLAAVVGTAGLSFEDTHIPTVNTTPDLFFLYPHLAHLREQGCTHLVLEASSQALADRRIDSLPVAVAAFTSFGRDHIGPREHASMEEYLCAKRRLFTDFSPSYTVLNGDDSVAASMPRGREGGVRCSLCGAGEVSAEVLSVGIGYTEYRYEGKLLRLPLMGRHFVTDALMAAACAEHLTGIAVGRLLPLLSDLHVRGRSEYLFRAGRHIVIDYAHNAMSLAAVAEACRALFPGRLIAVFGTVGGRAEGRRAELAEAADALFDLTVLTSDTAGREETACLCEQMRRHFSHPTRVRVELSRQRAIRLAFSLSRAGDVLLLLGKGEEGHAECAQLTDRRVAEALG